MKFLNYLFGKKNDKDQKNDQSPFLPKEKDSTELIFAKNFTKKGGKFIYCENKDEVLDYFEKILKENGWDREDILCDDKSLSDFFKINEPSEKNIFNVQLLTCEFLIANKGSILICSNQIFDKKLNKIPENLIFFSYSNQFVPDVSEAMSNINIKYNNDLPTNITTINSFNTLSDKDFLSYGSASKNLYLLIQE